MEERSKYLVEKKMFSLKACSGKPSKKTRLPQEEVRGQGLQSEQPQNHLNIWDCQQDLSATGTYYGYA